MTNQDRATTEQAEAGAMLPNLPESFGDHCVTDSVRTMREPGYTADQMRAYAQAAIDALTRKGGEAVVWQFRFGDRWAECTQEEFNRFQQNSPLTAASETRALYAEPTRAQEGKSGRAEFVKGYVQAGVLHCHGSTPISAIEASAHKAADKIGYAAIAAAPRGGVRVSRP